MIDELKALRVEVASLTRERNAVQAALAAANARADEWQALAKTNAASLAVITEALAAARREYERLRKALEPFARMADRKDGWPADSGCAHLPSMAQVRAARAALSAPADGDSK